MTIRELKNGHSRSFRLPAEDVALLKADIANLSPEEKEAVELILAGIADPVEDAGGVAILKEMGRLDWKRTPVSMKEFVHNEYYLGNTCDTLYEQIEEDLTELFDGDYRECIFCLHPDTAVPLLDGSTQTIGEMGADWTESSKPFWVYSITEDGDVVPAQADHPRQTGVDDYYKVTLDDGTHFVANARHQMVTRAGVKKMVRDFNPGDSLMPFGTDVSKRTRGKRRIEGYELVLNPRTDSMEYTHAVVTEAVHGEIDSSKLTVHHANYDKCDNRPENLEPLSWQDHAQRHADEKSAYLAEHPEVRAKLSARGREIATDPDSALRKGHRKFMRSPKGHALARRNLAHATNTKEELSRRGRKGCEVRWRGVEAPRQRIKAAERMAARNRASTGPRASSIADNELLLRTIEQGASTAKAAAHALGWTEGKVYKVLYRTGMRSRDVFQPNNHYVVSVERVGRGPVYCMTVPSTTNFAICTRNEDGTFSRNGLFSSNTGAIGWGKTFGVSIGVCYLIYLLSCMRDPHASFGIAPNSNITIACLSVNEQLATKVAYENIATKIEASPYFQENFPFEKTKKELRFPKKIWVAARATTDSSVLGLNVIGGFLDEANFMHQRGNKNDPRFDLVGQAENLYNAMQRRMKSRFERKGKLPGILFVVSSKQTANDFTAKRIRESKDDPTIFVRDYSLWDVKPDIYYSGDWFHVVVGNEQSPSRVLKEDEDPDLVATTINEGCVMVAVPSDYRHDFEKDLEGSIRDLAGVATVSVSPYIQRRDKIEAAIDHDREHPFTVEVLDPSQPGRFKWNQMVKPQADMLLGDGVQTFNKPIINPRAVRHIHIDPSLTGDATGFAMGHIAEWRTVIRRDEEDRTEYQERAPVLFIDCVLRIVPPIGDEIVLGDVRKLVYALSKHGYTITSVTMDSWGNGSHDGVQKLSQKGFNASILSVDKTMGPYELLKEALYEDRLKLYDYPVLIRELRELERDWVKKKVDHPAGGTKDVSDAVAGICATLSEAAMDMPVSFVRSSAGSGDAWMAEQQQYAAAAREGFGGDEEEFSTDGIGDLPAFLTGDSFDDGRW